MSSNLIRKSAAVAAGANMPDYLTANAGFDWEQARAHIDGLPDGGAEHGVRGGRPARRGG